MLDNPAPLVPNDLDDYTEQMAERMNTAYKFVSEQLHCVFSSDKKRYDARVKECRFSVGDWVWFYCPRRKLNRNRKWQLFTSGPYLVTARINLVNYAIQMGPRGRKIIVHVDRLRRYEGNISAVNEHWRQSILDVRGRGGETNSEGSDPAGRSNITAPPSFGEFRTDSEQTPRNSERASQVDEACRCSEHRSRVRSAPNMLRTV